MKREPTQNYERRLPLCARIAHHLGGGVLGWVLGKLPAGGTETTGLRDYSPGDDPRRVEWGICARHDELRVREYGGTAVHTAYLLVDVSYGMSLSAEKWEALRNTVVTLLYGALDFGASVHLGTYGGTFSLRGALTGTHQLGAALRFWELLERERAQSPPAPADIPDFALLAEAFLALNRPVGEVYVVSDFFGVSDSFEKDFRAGLETLQRAGFPPRLIHLTTPSDRGENLIGDVEITDPARGFHQVITLTEHDLEQYQRLYDGYLERVAAFCASRKYPYARVSAGLSPDAMSLAALGIPVEALTANPWREFITTDV